MRIEYGEMVLEVNREEYLVIRDALMVLNQSIANVNEGRSCDKAVKETLEQVLQDNNYEKTYARVIQMLDEMKIKHRRHHR